MWKFFKSSRTTIYITTSNNSIYKKLEEELGGTLFYRNTKGISLTEEGKIIIKGSNTVIEQILEKPLYKFIKTYPNIKIDILKGGHIDSLKDLSEGRIDMAVLNLPVSYEYKNIEIIEICKEECKYEVMSEELQKN